MMTIRLTEKLAKKIKESGLGALPMNVNPFADWSARVFTADRAQYILITNTATLYSRVIYGKGITDDNAFIHAVGDSLRDMMEEDGFGAVYYERIAPEATSVRFAKNLDRSIIGSMNQLEFEAKTELTLNEISPYDLSFRLNKTLLSYDKHYDHPRDVFQRTIQGLSNVIPMRRRAVRTTQE